MGKTPYIMHHSTEKIVIMPRDVQGYWVRFLLENLSDDTETLLVGIRVSAQEHSDCDIVGKAREKLLRRIGRIEVS